MNRYILKANEPIEFYQNGPHIHDRIDTDPVHNSYVENFESLVSLDGFSGIDDKFNSFVVYDEDRKCFHSSTHTLFTCTGETWGDIVLDIFTAVKPRFKIYIRG